MDGNSIAPTHSVNVPTRIGDPPRRRGENPSPEHRERRQPPPSPAPVTGGGEPSDPSSEDPSSLDVFV